MDPISYLQQVHHFLAKRKFVWGLLEFHSESCKAIYKISPRYLSSEILLHSLSLLDPVFLRSSFNLFIGALKDDQVYLCWRLLCLFPFLNQWLMRFHDLTSGFPFLNNIQTEQIFWLSYCYHLTFLFFFLYLLIWEWMF